MRKNFTIITITIIIDFSLRIELNECVPWHCAYYSGVGLIMRMCDAVKKLLIFDKFFTAQPWTWSYWRWQCQGSFNVTRAIHVTIVCTHNWKIDLSPWWASVAENKFQSCTFFDVFLRRQRDKHFRVPADAYDFL